MQSLLGGADCASTSNPLEGLLKRESGAGGGLMRDRTVAGSSKNGSSSLNQLPFRPSPSPQPFLLAQPQSSSSSSSSQAFNLSHLSTALKPHPQQQQRPASTSSNWGGEFSQFNGGGRLANGGEMERIFAAQQHRNHLQHHPQPPPQVQAPSSWAGDFQGFSGKGKSREMSPAPSQSQQPQQYQAQQQPQHYPMDYALPASSLSYPSYNYLPQPQYPQSSYAQPQAQIIPLEGEVGEEQMEEAFRRAMEEEEDRIARESKESEGAVMEGEGEEFVGKEPMGDFEAVWQSLKPEAERMGKLAEWEKEFSQFANGEEDYDFDNMGGLDAMADMADGLRGAGVEVGPKMGEDGFPVLGDYEFEKENPHIETSDSLQRALSLLSSGGSLTEACLLLESTLQSGTAKQQASEIPGFDGGEAAVWVLLGQTQAMDEKEVAAVRALEEGRRRFESGAGGDGGKKVMGEGLVSLAISYTNESYDHSSLLALHRYLTLLHPTYAGAPPVSHLENLPSLEEEDTSFNPWQANQGITESFLALARDQHARGEVDAEVQVGLGVLYYQTGEYERARDCWVAALGVRPNDFLLWNRLGATLANSGKPEEAIDAYRRALELKPTFTRAIYNLGVSCLNIKVYHEAAEHLLAGLSLHRTQDPSRNLNDPHSSSAASNHSSTLWSTLRRTFLAMERPDLAERAVAGADLEVFRSEGFDF